MTLFEYLAIAFGSRVLYRCTSRCRWVSLCSCARSEVLGAIGGDALPHSGYRGGLLDFLVIPRSRLEVSTVLLALTVPGVWYYCSSVLVPENPEGVLNWRGLP